MGVGAQHHTPAALPPLPLEGWVGPRAGLKGCGKSRLPDPPAPSESLYRLSYPGTICWVQSCLQLLKQHCLVVKPKKDFLRFFKH